jgi:hypothetical protein
MGRWQDEVDEILGEEDEEDLEGEWELDPNDPSHPDYDLSEAAGYAEWEPRPRPWLLREGVVFGITLLVVLALTLGVMARVF